MRRFLVIYYDGWNTKQCVLDTDLDLVSLPRHDPIEIMKLDPFKFEPHNGDRTQLLNDLVLNAVVEIDPTKEPNVWLCL